MKQATVSKDEGNLLFKKGLLIAADEMYSRGADILEVSGYQGGVRSKSGDEDENRLLALCHSNRAQCTLNMAEGKGVLDDGRPFISQFDDQSFLEQFRRQALEQ